MEVDVSLVNWGLSSAVEIVNSETLMRYSIL